MVLFIVGVIEMLIVTLWTKFVTRTQILASGVVTLINVLIWYYVLQSLVADLKNWQLAALYALGCALGTVAGTYYFQLTEKKPNLSGDK